ncbi:MAG: hypothetical protein AB7Q04_11130 [Steroidobacteraceae bacterium]
MNYKKANTSFLSGHDTIGALYGILLSQMVPKKQAALFMRAGTYRKSLMIVAAHFRTDVDAGRLLVL